MDNLTDAVLATITSDSDMARRALEIARNTATREHQFQTAEDIGNAICTEIGERLSTRYDGAVPKDGIHDSLWMTFMGQVAWDQVGKYYLEDQEAANQS